MSSHILSLDIREDAVSAVLIATGLKGNVIETYTHVPFNGAPSETEDPLEWAIDQVIGHIGVSGVLCLLSVPSTETTYRNLKIPFKDKKKIAQVLPFELEPSLPFPIDELTMDFQVIRKAEYSDVIAAAVRTDYLEAITERLKRHDLVPRFITSSGIAEAMCLARLAVEPVSDFILIDVKGTSATAIAVCSGSVHLIRTFKVACNDSGQSFKRLSGDITRMMAAFETIYDFDFQPEKIFFSGMDSDDALWISGIENTMGISARSIDILKDVQLKINPASEEEDAPPWLNAPLGLASVETDGTVSFNFSRQRYMFQKYWMENKNELITSGLLTALVLVLMIIHVSLESRNLQDKIRKIDGRITEIFQSTFGETTTIVDPVQQMRVNLKQMKEKSNYSTNSGESVLNIDVLKNISELVSPDIDVVMTRFVRDDDSIILSGTTDTFNAVDDVKIRLEKSEFFEQLTISSANMDKTANRVRFSIKADLSGS